MTEPDGSAESLDLGTYLWACLSTRRHEYDQEVQRDSDQEHLWLGFDKIERYALQLLTTGQIPDAAIAELQDFMPGDSLSTKLRELLGYNIVRDRVQFHVAEGVVEQLDDLDKRVGLTVMAFFLLSRAKPSPIATKYLERASSLYLAGYSTEVVIMCGAVLEAAMAERYPNETLERSGVRPVFARSGEFSLGQRMRFEESHPIFSEDQRAKAWQLINNRNDAVHVHPEVSAAPAEALLFTAWILPAILPGDYASGT